MGPVTMTRTTFGDTPAMMTPLDDETWVVATDGGARACQAELSLLGVTADPAGRRLLVEVLLYRRTNLSAEVYDLAGGLVRALAGGRVAPGRRVIAWDGADAAGDDVAPGLYQVLVRGETEEATWSVERVAGAD